MSSVENILNELRTIIPEENFHLQPDSSLKVIFEMENKYGLSSEDFLNFGSKSFNINLEDREIWLNNLETYNNFIKGDV